MTHGNRDLSSTTASSTTSAETATRLVSALASSVIIRQRGIKAMAVGSISAFCLPIAQMPLPLNVHLCHDRAVLVHQPGEVLTPRRSYGAAPGRTPHTAAPTFALDLMAGFSVFFCDSQRCSIQPVRAMDRDHAIAQVRSATPDLRRVAVIPDALLEGVDPEQLLQEWIQTTV